MDPVRGGPILPQSESPDLTSLSLLEEGPGEIRASENNLESATQIRISTIESAPTDLLLDQSQVAIESLRSVLAAMRNQIRDLLSSPDSVEEMMHLTTEIYTRQFVEISKMAEQRLLAKGEKCPIGEKWSLFGIGSLGRGEVCPYSDLDFAILVDTIDEDVKRYFKAFVTEINSILVDLEDKGMHLCEGEYNPPYEREIRGEIVTKGKNELLTTPETLAQTTVDLAFSPSSILSEKPYTILNSRHLYGDKSLAKRFLNTLTSKDNKPSPENPEFLRCQIFGLVILKTGYNFWDDNNTVKNLEINSSTPPADETKIYLPHCNFKSALLRPIQHSVMGICRFYGILEPNTIKALRILIAQEKIEKGLGLKLIAAYKQVFGLRLSLEIGEERASCVVTRFPEHFTTQYSKARALSDEEYEIILSANEAVQELHKLVDLLEEQFL